MHVMYVGKLDVCAVSLQGCPMVSFQTNNTNLGRYIF
jgi:hypothetical protein